MNHLGRSDRDTRFMEFNLLLQVQEEDWWAAGAAVLVDDPEQPGEPHHLPGLQQEHALHPQEQQQLQLSGYQAPDLSDLETT